MHSQPQPQKLKQAKQKLSKAAQNLQASFSSVGISVSPVKVISQSIISSANCNNSDLDTLMNELKSKFQSSSYQEKILILTLKPDSWTTEKTSTFFDTTKHAVKKAISLKKEGILSMPKRAKQQGIRVMKICKRSQIFFLIMNIQRQLSSRKDYVRVRIEGKKATHAKTTLIRNLV